MDSCVHSLDERYDRGTTFRLNLFLNGGGSLTQNRQKQAFFLSGVLVVYLGHGIFHPVPVLFLQISF